jgi:hypothetical protein
MSDTDSDSSEYTRADSEPDDSELTEPRLTPAGGNLIETGLNVSVSKRYSKEIPTAPISTPAQLNTLHLGGHLRHQIAWK